MKISILFLLLIFGLTTVEAQQSTAHTHAYFGVRIAGNFAHPDFSKGSPPVAYKTTWGKGFSAGLFLNVPLSPKLFIQPEYLFTQINSEIDDTENELKFNYLSLPVLLKYCIYEKLTVLTGLQFDLLINAESNLSDKATDMTHHTEERSISAIIGMEFFPVKSFSIGLRYISGLNHIGLRQNNTTEEFKFEAVQVTGSYLF